MTLDVGSAAASGRWRDSGTGDVEGSDEEPAGTWKWRDAPAWRTPATWNEEPGINPSGAHGGVRGRRPPRRFHVPHPPWFLVPGTREYATPVNGATPRIPRSRVAVFHVPLPRCARRPRRRRFAAFLVVQQRTRDEERRRIDRPLPPPLSLLWRVCDRADLDEYPAQTRSNHCPCRVRRVEESLVHRVERSPIIFVDQVDRH